jgi:hypothetical protein
MEHARICWNPENQEWFCTKCGRTSDHVAQADAMGELAQFECRLPFAEETLSSV